MNNKPSVKILVGYHKPSTLLKDDIFVPIHLGRALSAQAVKNLEFKQDDYQWMLDNMVGDDTGDNISHLNKEFCELTAIYWAWKNYDKLGNPDYIGFMHYRRHFIFSEKYYNEFDEIPDNIVFPSIDDDYITDIKLHELKNDIADYDLILPNLFDIHKTFGKNFYSINDVYGSPTNSFYNFNLTTDILIDKYPEYECVKNDYYNNAKIYFKNMFVMQRDDFFSLCSFVFDILFENHNQIDYSCLPANRRREVAHTAEIVLGIYFHKMILDGNKKIKFTPLSYIAEAPSCKIAVSYHKKDFLIKDNIFQPIHSGRALALQSSKDGSMSESDYQWMLDNMIGDDTGDNISLENRKYGEVSSIYWLWKNYVKFGNPDYIGFTHYRRQFVFNPSLQKDIRLFLKTFQPTDISRYMNHKHIYQAIKDCDICMVKPVIWHSNLYNQYKDAHEIRDLDFVLNYIKENYPEFYSTANDYFKNNKSIFGNLWIMKKEIFFEYSKFLFDILFALDKSIDYDSYSAYNQRTCGFMAERLTGIFIMQKLHENRIKIKELSTMFIQNTSISEDLHPAFSKNNVAMFCSTDDNYAQYCGVLLKSIIENSDSNYNYDLIVLEEYLSDINKQKIKAIQEGYSNVSIRFFNVSNLMLDKRFHLCAHFTIATYYRMFVSSIFKNYQKIVYMDIDTICLFDIANLYNQDVDNYLLAAALDYGVLAKIKTNKCEPVEYFQERLNVANPFKEYFQAGVLLFNVSEFKKQNLEGVLINTALTNKFNYVDQDVLNKVCYGQVKFIDTSWNTTTQAGSKKKIMELLPIRLYEKYLSDRLNPKIIHFASYEKPWKSPDGDLASHWWHYARMTPFYEEIIYRNTKSKQSVTNTGVSKDMLNNILAYKKNRFKYYRYKILSKITFGKTRKRYKQKRKDWKFQLNKVREYLNKK